MLPNDILDMVCGATGVTLQQLLSRDRHRRIAEARHMAAYILHVLMCYSTTEAAAFLHREHAMVIHSCRTAQMWLDDPRTNPRAAHLLNKLCSEL